ncbi:hypothetical protein C2G38_2089969 [Gigaspora rosea]|uniref:Serine-threonine/tyrosine-protein kinase catalytic domain-containing protein n=1 Tax=Gigaspora rosea TaxID=44941 RepID=A0A397V2M9_9GLOM|nr:hypothetical protein C2G38_2089969 [Gigaspora rosea]
MWEILYGKSVSCNQEFGTQLQIKICRENLRPIIIENTPQCYINLMKKCWEKIRQNNTYTSYSDGSDGGYKSKFIEFTTSFYQDSNLNDLQITN